MIMFCYKCQGNQKTYIQISGNLKRIMCLKCGKCIKLLSEPIIEKEDIANGYVLP